MTVSPMTPPRRRSTFLLATLVASSLVITLSMTAAQADPVGPTPTPGQLSSELPTALRDEATGLLVRPETGQEQWQHQRVRAEAPAAGGVSLNVYDPPALGGSLVKSTPTDLGIMPLQITEDLVPIPLFSRWSNEDTKACVGCLAYVADYYHFRTIYAASSNAALDDGGPIFVTGSQGGSLTPTDPSEYPRNLLYRVDPGITCAVQSCVRVAVLPNYYPDGGRIVGVTALAAGRVGDIPVVAVGLTDGGVSLYDADFNFLGTFGGMATGDGSQTPVTALAFDPAGSGWLAVGALSHGSIGFFLQLKANDNGGLPTVPTTYTTWAQQGTDALSTIPLSVAFGHDAGGKLVAGFGLNAGRLSLVDPTINSTNALATFTLPNPSTAAVSTVNTVPRIDGSTGGGDWAITIQNGDNFGEGNGALVRFNGTTGSLLPLEPASGNDSGTLLDTLDEFRSWFPGYKMGQLGMLNLSKEPVTVRLLARSEGGYGCWYAPASAGTPFPSDGITLQPSDDAGLHSLGAYTAGSQGLCGAADVSGARRGYLVIAPVNRPGDARIVNVQLKDDYTVDVSDQVGGALMVEPEFRPGRDGPYGLFSLYVDAPDQPAPLAAPTVTGKLLTLPVRGRNAVYRFDVGAMSWSVPGATGTPAQLQATIPPLQVQASLDGSTWTNVGEFVSVNALNQAGTRITSGTAATGSGSFYWENPDGAPNYSQIRVVAGPLASTPVVLASRPAPPTPAKPITSVTVASAKSAVTTAAPAANGVDQAPLLVTVAAGIALPASDPAYDTVYYRDESDNLVTNLYEPGAFDDFIGVQPSAGAYPNTGSVGRPRGGAPGATAFDYASTAGSILHRINGFVGTAAPTVRSGAVSVQGTALNIARDPQAKAALGFSLEGCSDYANSDTCQLAPITAGSRPALYQAGDAKQGPLIGVQLQAQARNALTDLPLQWTTKVDQLKLASSPVSVSSTTATMTNKNGFTPSYDVDTWLVSHGQLISITGLPVGGG